MNNKHILSRLYNDYTKKFILVCYFVFFTSLILIGLLMNFKIFYYLFMMIPLTHLILFQTNKLNINKPNDCLTKFKSNNFLGLIVFVNILIGKII